MDEQLFDAVCDINKEFVEALLKRGASPVGYKIYNNETALHWASLNDKRKRYFEVAVATLLSCKSGRFE